MRANIVNDRGDLATPVGRPVAGHEYPDRLVEFAYALSGLVQLQLGAKRDLEKTFPDFFVSEVGPLGGAPGADVRVFSIRKTAAESRECHRGKSRQRQLAQGAGFPRVPSAWSGKRNG